MLRQLLHAFGPAALVVGTDYPFNFHERAPMQRLENAGFDAATLQAISHGNARRFLGLASRKDSE
ncbi:Amidohydrolase [compost metagenome]